MKSRGRRSARGAEKYSCYPSAVTDGRVFLCVGEYDSETGSDCRLASMPLSGGNAIDLISQGGFNSQIAVTNGLFIFYKRVLKDDDSLDEHVMAVDFNGKELATYVSSE